MNFRTYLVLFILALVPPIVIAQFQPAPGYLDSDYYYAGGIQLVSGKGFTEPYMWNYLDGSTSLPHPSHAYWQPLASIIAALGMWLTGETTYAAARLFFILIAGLVSPVTAALAWKFTHRRDLAITSGLLAIFCVYSAPFMGVTDNFGIFMLLGGLYFILVLQLIEQPELVRNWLLLGLLAGLMTLSRSDGLLWLGVTFLFAVWRVPRTSVGNAFRSVAFQVVIVLLGFLIVMGPWYARNFQVYGSIMAPGGSRALWLENYDQTFMYPPSMLNKDTFLASGWGQISITRLKALWQNFQSAFAAHGEIILFPFILAGVYDQRRHPLIKLAAFAWLILFLVMSILFPFAGARGAFFHAGAAFQPIWWMLAPLGLEAVLAFLRKRNWGDDQARVVFRGAMVTIVIILTGFAVYLRLFTLGWSVGEENYRPIEMLLEENGIGEKDIVIVRNPPGYYLETGRSAVPIPFGDEKTLLDVAAQFEAYYLVLEKEAVLAPMKDLFEDPNGNPNFVFLGELDEAKLYRIELSNISKKDLWTIAAASVLMALIYLLASKLVYGIGFPLDDSWIHQTYARNLAEYGEWAFRPGITSAGSTSPLWSALLSIGFLVGLSPYIWTYFLGALIIFSLATVCEWAARNLLESYRPGLPWVAFFMVFEWHLSWAAMSGMETLLHGLILTSVLILLMTSTPRYLTLGLLTGLATWVRPDGLTLIVPVLMVILLSEKDAVSRSRAIGRYLIGFGSLFIPYLLFNLAIGGTPMPNTFYAKQAEYAAWQNKSIFSRLGQMSLQLLAGPSIAILPGVGLWISHALKRKLWGNIAAILWCLGYLLLYLMRLPVYQHGRYIMPAMPVFFLFGLLAFLNFNQSKRFGRYHWIVQAFWYASTAALLLAFVFIGSNAYAQDVAIIESEMVVTAKWVSVNLPQDSLLAVHDIGAMGYFDDHAIIDLAGLVSPEVIPFIRDEAKIASYLDERGADDLIAFPDFYPLLTQNAEVVFESGSEVTILAGEKNMKVYVWKTP